MFVYSLPLAIIECYSIAGRCKRPSPLCADLEHACRPFVLQPDWELCPVHRKPFLRANSLISALHRGGPSRKSSFLCTTDIGWAGHGSRSSLPQPNTPASGLLPIARLGLITGIPKAQRAAQWGMGTPGRQQSTLLERKLTNLASTT